MLKIRIICIGLCITEDKVVQNVHIDLNINEEQQTEKTDEIKENKPEEIKQDVIEQTKPKYSFIQKFICIIILIFLIGLFIFAISQIKKMREQKKDVKEKKQQTAAEKEKRESEEKTLLVEFLKKEKKYQTETKTTAELIKKFDEIKFSGTKLGDLIFCQKDQENFLVVTKDEENNYFVYMFFPYKQEMILIDSKNCDKYKLTGSPSDRNKFFLGKDVRLKEEKFLISEVFHGKKTKEIFEDIVDRVFSIQDFFLQKTEVFINTNGQIHRAFKIATTENFSVKTKYYFLEFFFSFLDFLISEKFLQRNDFSLGLSDDFSVIFYDPKKKEELKEIGFGGLLLLNEKNFLNISNDLNKKILIHCTLEYQTCYFIQTFFKGDLYLSSSKIDEKKFKYLLEKVEERSDWFQQKEFKKISLFFTKNKKLFEKALKKCKEGASEAKIMSMNDFLEIFLNEEEIKTLTQQKINKK